MVPRSLPSVGIVHEWLTNRAGSEKCVEAMRDAFPTHHIYTSVLNEDAFPGWAADVSTSFLQRVPPIRRSHIMGLPAMVPAMRTLKIAPDHDLVIRSFHSFATLPPGRRGVPEIVYCYTPPRFLYGHTTLADESLVVRAGMRLSRATLRRGDQRRMQLADNVVAISRHIATRMANVYGIEAEVIHPPVDVEHFRQTSGLEREDYYVFCSRLVPYKKPGVAIEAFRNLPFRLVVVGDGRLRAELERDAPPNVTFVGRVGDAELPAVIGKAAGFVFPGEEDFGIAPVEALAAGTPVVAFEAGGALDYVVHGENGLLVNDQTPEAFAAAVRRSAQISWDRGTIEATAARFSRDRFIHEIRDLADKILASVGA